MVKNAKKRLEESGLYTLVGARWKDVDWVTRQSQTIDQHVSFQEPTKIFLYPSLKTLSEPQASREIFTAFGCLVEKTFNKEQNRLFEKRWSLPEEAHIKSFIAKLGNGHKSYTALVESSNDPVERLVHLHLCNGLIANNLSIKDAANLNPLKWPSIEDFANRKTYFSLIPLTSAYAPSLCCFGKTFAAAAFGFGMVYHTAIRKELAKLVVNILK